MAKVRINAILGEYGAIGDIVDGNALQVVVAAKTMVTLVDNEGDGFTFTGSNLQYSQGGIIGGTFTGLRIFTGADATLETVTNFNFKAAELFQIYSFGGLSAAVLQLLSKDDLVIGSKVGDVLIGGFGKDTIKGGGGADVIGGSTGNDKLFGQAGPDQFVFVAGDGRDRIMDFTDTGGKADDQIVLTQKMYDIMTVEETNSGVTLHFGNKGTIVVDNWHAADVDLTDFLIT